MFDGATLYWSEIVRRLDEMTTAHADIPVCRRFPCCREFGRRPRCRLIRGQSRTMAAGSRQSL